MSDIPQATPGSVTRCRRLEREAMGARERPPLGPSDQPSLADLAVCTLWITGVALIVASLFL